MKRSGRILGTFLVLLLAVIGPLNAQGGMRGMMRDSVRMERMRRGSDMNQNKGMSSRPDSLRMRSMRPGFGPFGMDRMYPYLFPGPGYGMRRWMWSDPWMGRMWRGYEPGWGQMPGRGMWSFPGDSTGVWRHRPGMWMFGNIPGLTDKQKKNIEELRQNQQDEMRKFRDEMMAKMKSLRESNRAKIMDLLTPDQRKWVEENRSNPPDK
jgi:Spy/CpxP family protein refolding chaperone